MISWRDLRLIRVCIKDALSFKREFYNPSKNAEAYSNIYHRWRILNRIKMNKLKFDFTSQKFSSKYNLILSFRLTPSEL